MELNSMIEMLMVCHVYGVGVLFCLFLAPGLQVGTDWQLAN
jgi:hypothetical protein